MHLKGDVRGRFTVSGRVQGVGYRYFTDRIASQFGLRGYVRNLWSGDVEIVLEGPRTILERALTEFRRGPSLAVVRDITVKWGKADGTFRDFSIRH
ncbi:MAG: acylphosphatase [Candidatus Latescibacteria bacterium]|nr:acylphosphatase [Candidatus Latescibacterota bacterium]